MNGRLETSWSDGELTGAARPRETVPGSSRILEGLSLQELAPLMSGIRNVEVRTAGDGAVILAGPVSGSLVPWSLVHGARGWDLRSDAGVHRNVTSVDIRGERLDEKDLTVWISWEGTALLAEEIDRFADRHGLTVDVLTVPSLLSKVTAAARAGDRLPDLFMVQSDYLPELVAGGLIQRLDDMDDTALVPQGRRAFEIDGPPIGRFQHCQVAPLWIDPDEGGVAQ